MKYENYRSWLIHHLLKQKYLLSFVFVSIILLTLARNYIPIVIGDIIDSVVTLGEESRVIGLLLLVLFLYLFNIIMDYISMMLGHNLGLQIEKNMRKEFFDLIQIKPLKYHDEAKTGDLQALATYDLRVVNSMIAHGAFYVYPFAQVIIATILLLNVLNFHLGLLFIPFLIAYIYTIMLYRKWVAPYVSKRMKKHSNMAVKLQDNITGASVVRSFSNKDLERIKFHNAVKGFRDNWIGENIVQSKYYPLLVLYIAIGVLLLASIGLFLQGVIGIGTVVSVNLLLVTLINPTNTIHWATRDMMSGFAACSRVFKSLIKDVEETQKDREKSSWPEDFKGKIKFVNVDFSYGDSEEDFPLVLENLNFTIEPEERIALVGPTGCGKTTLVKLILSLYDPEKGKILLDGRDIRELPTDTLRKHIAYVEQDTYLFPRSIKENIRFGNPEASDEKIKEVAKLAQVDDFVKKLPKKYDTIVGERGTKLSGGERQRVSIARALLTDPNVVILDDSVSAIDSKTEEKIGKAIENILRNRTTIIITHRLHKIRAADKIIILKEGRIKAIGNHDTLIKESPDYRRIFQKQLELPQLKLERKEKI